MSKKIKSLLGALLLFCIMAAAQIPLSYVSAESASASDFQMKGDVLVKYTGTASAVSIPASVKKIGKEAFLGHKELIKVEIPGYVESIEYNAFSGCSSLESISIPDTVTKIGNGAFSGCSSLKTIALGRKVNELGIGIFSNCTSLKEVRLNKDNKNFSYDNGVIYSKDKTIVYSMLPGYQQDFVYKMPSTVKEIKSNAFWGCMNLKRVEIGRNVEEIPDYAFANCRNLDKVMLPYSLHRIGLKAFADCINLGETEIPISVADIHKTAFDGCPRLTIIAEEGSRAAEYEVSREKTNVAQAEYQDIMPAEGEVPVTEEQTQKEEGTGAATLGQSLVVGGNAVVFIDNNRSKVLSGNVRPNVENGEASTQLIDGQMHGSLPKYTIVSSRKIAAQAYYGDNSLTEYRMPETIEEIGDFAFARSALTSLMIPDGVTTIGYGAFYHCDELVSVTIPDTVVVIEPSAFDKTQWMEERLSDRQKPFTVVGDGILIAYSGIGNKVQVPEGVKHIGAEVFKDRDNITDVSLPSTLVSVGEDAFAGCISLTSVTGGSNVLQIKDRAFSRCPIGTMKIPASVKEIGRTVVDCSETAVFLGKTLPRSAYEKTATRLVNEEYRGAVLKDVKIAIVDDSISLADIENTVLDYNKGGFRGLICAVEQAAEGNTPGILKVKFYAMSEKEARYNGVPTEATVYGKLYEVISQEEAPIYMAGESGGAEEKGTISVETDSRTLPDTFKIKAELAGSKNDYILRINDNNTEGGAIGRAYAKATAGNRMTSLQVYDIGLYDEDTMIPISRLGKERVVITIPKPKGIAAAGLKAVCMDEDGQLENVNAYPITIDGQSCVQFEAQHFSVYGFYN